MRITEAKPGTRVMCNGYPGAVDRIYSGSMVDVRLDRGAVCVDVSELRKLAYYESDGGATAGIWAPTTHYVIDGDGERIDCESKKEARALVDELNEAAAVAQGRAP